MTAARNQMETGAATRPFCSGVTPANAGISLHETPLRSVFVSDKTTRVVLDTNVLVSLWLFADSRYLPLRAALDDGRWLALANEAAFGEFARVAAYPQFGASAALQLAALADYRRLARAVDAPPADAPLPRCRDKDDQKFLELARDGGADWLVTSDKDLLRLARRQKLAGLFRILTPDAALAEMAESATA